MSQIRYYGCVCLMLKTSRRCMLTSNVLFVNGMIDFIA